MARWLPHATLAVALLVAIAATTTHAARTEGGAAAVVGGMLDDFHVAASLADGERYFGHFAPDGVFLGTDATERWTVEQFRAYARPYFEKGQGWTYTAKERHISFSPDGGVAWFDERLDNVKWGECRGSGVLVRMGETWKISQYNLTVPIPNDLLPEVCAKIMAHGAE